MSYAILSKGLQFEPPNKSIPTHTLPGSPQKLQVMADRYCAGQPIHHVDDEELVAFPIRKAASVFLVWTRQRTTEPSSMARGNRLRHLNVTMPRRSDGAMWQTLNSPW